MIDRAGLAEFLRRRREALQPEDVGLPRGRRRRTSGLRREEVAVLCHMSTDYYSRLEQNRGPQPSEQMVASIAQGLHLSLDERDHLFRLAGHRPPERGAGSDHVSPGMLRIFDRLADTPAEIVTELGETLRQTPLGVALVGDATRFTGPARSIGYRWFTDATGADGARFSSLTPARILDTRTETGRFSSPVGAAGTISPTVVGVGGVPATGVSAVVLNVTGTQPAAAESYLTVIPSGAARPLASNLNSSPARRFPTW